MADVLEFIKNTLDQHGFKSSASAVPKDFEFESPVQFGDGVILRSGVRIGANSYMNGGMIRDNVTIGRFCSIAYGVTIGIGSHYTDLLSTHPFTSRAGRDHDHQSPFKSTAPQRAETIVGNDVWIGQNATILAGIAIGDGAVVAAHSVVRQDVAPYAIVGGVPGKPLRYRFDEATIRDLLDVRWWELPMDFLLTLPVNNIGECIRLIRAASPDRIPVSYRRADQLS